MEARDAALWARPGEGFNKSDHECKIGKGRRGLETMRILYFAHQRPSGESGGAPWVARELFEASRRRGHVADLICAADAGETPAAPLTPVPGAEGEHSYAGGAYLYPLFRAADPEPLAALRAHVERFRPDVVHFHHYHALGLEALAAARQAAPGAALMLSFHEMMAICLAEGRMVRRDSGELCHEGAPMACQRCFPDLSGDFFRFRRARLEAVFARCDGFVFPSAFLARRYADWGLDPRRSAVIPNGLGPSRAEARPRPAASPNASRFGFFGQRLDHKGLDVALAALGRLARSGRVPASGLTFEIHGGGEAFASPAYRERLSALAADLRAHAGAGVTLRDAGPYRRDELPQRMAGVDWVVAPSTWWEAFGLVVSEAWALGRPVIVSAIAGLAERVRENVDGLTFPPGDADALAGVFARACGDAALWARLAGGIRTPPSGDAMFAAHEDLYLRRLAEPRRSSEAPAPNPKNFM